MTSRFLISLNELGTWAVATDTNNNICLVSEQTKTWCTYDQTSEVLTVPTKYTAQKRWTFKTTTDDDPTLHLFLAAVNNWAALPRLRPSFSRTLPPSKYAVRILRADEPQHGQLAESKPRQFVHCITAAGHVKNGSRNTTQTNHCSASVVNLAEITPSDLAKHIVQFVERTIEKFDQTRQEFKIIAFDINEVSGKVINTQDIDNLGVAENFAANDREIVIEGWIPPEAVICRASLRKDHLRDDATRCSEAFTHDVLLRERLARRYCVWECDHERLLTEHEGLVELATLAGEEGRRMLEKILELGLGIKDLALG